MLVSKVKALTAVSGFALNLRQGVTPISHEAYDLHMLILWICVAIGVKASVRGSGRNFTRLQVLLYTILLVVITVLPFVTHMSGLLYLGGALVLATRLVPLSLIWVNPGRLFPPSCSC